MNIIKSYIVTNAAASTTAGTVTSVGDLPPLFTTANGSSTPTFTAINQNANLFYAGPATGAAAAPTFRALVSDDIPLTATQIGFGSATGKLTGSTSFTWADSTKILTMNGGVMYTDATNKNFIWGTSLSIPASITGNNNIILGEATGARNNNLGTFNFLAGRNAGLLINGAQHQVAIGTDALRFSTTSGENVALGYRALYQATGEDNVGIGFAPLHNMIGSRNNTALGYYAGAPTAAGAMSNGSDYTSGSGSLFIGPYAGTDAATESGQINIQNVIFSRGNSGTNPPSYPEIGRVGLYITSPTARLHLPGGTATANTASLKINSGTLLSTTEAGAIENDGTHLYVTFANSGTRYQLDQQSGSGWSLASGGTLTGTNTITHSAPNRLNFTGTWTGTADSDYGRRFTGAITGSGTAAHNFFGDQFTTSLTAGANNQILNGVYVAPTFATGGFTGTNVRSLYVVGSSVAGATSLLCAAGAVNNSNNFAASFSDSGATTLLSIRSDAVLTHAGTSIGFFDTSYSTAANASNQYIITHNRTPDAGGTAVALRSSANIASTTGDRTLIGLRGGTFSPTSGSATITHTNLTWTVNQTSTASGSVTVMNFPLTYTSVLGTLTWLNYQPTVTSVTGAHYGIIIGNTAVLSGFGVTAPTAVIHTAASTTARASLCLPHGTAPTSPVNGDIWTTTAGIFVRVNGSTVGPLS